MSLILQVPVLPESNVHLTSGDSIKYFTFAQSWTAPLLDICDDNKWLKQLTSFDHIDNERCNNLLYENITFNEPSWSQNWTTQVNYCNICNKYDTLSSIEDNTTLSSVYDNIGNNSIAYWQFFELPFYRNFYSNLTTIQDVLEIDKDSGPYLELCNPSSQKYAYRCFDAYYNFFIPFRYDAMPIMAVIAFLIVLILISIGIIIPRVVKMFKLFMKPRSEFLSSDEVICGMPRRLARLFVLLFCDVRTYNVTFLLLTCLMGVISNFILSFRHSYPLFKTYPFNNPAGVFRVLMFLSTIACYAGLVTQWLHVTDRLYAGKQSRIMSKKLYALMFTVHIINICMFIFSGILSLALGSSRYVFLLLSIAYTIWGIIFIGLFIFAGIRLYRRLRKSTISSNNQTNSKFTQYRFTKFLIVISVWILILVITSLLSIPLFVGGSDIYSLPLSFMQTPWYEFIGLCTLVILALNMINGNEFKSTYLCKPTKL